MTVTLIRAARGTYAVLRDGTPMGSIRRERRGKTRAWKATGIQGRQTIIDDRNTAARWVAQA